MSSSAVVAFAVAGIVPFRVVDGVLWVLCGFHRGRKRWELLGGKRDGSESAHDAALRETWDELRIEPTDVDANYVRQLQYTVTQTPSNQVAHMFFCPFDLLLPGLNADTLPNDFAQLEKEGAEVAKISWFRMTEKEGLRRTTQDGEVYHPVDSKRFYKIMTEGGSQALPAAAAAAAADEDSEGSATPEGVIEVKKTEEQLQDEADGWASVPKKKKK